MQLCSPVPRPSWSHTCLWLERIQVQVLFSVTTPGCLQSHFPLDPRQHISVSFLEHHLKGRNEPALNSSFNMTCPFEIVQITMSDCHVELQAWMWNAPKSDWSQILGHKSTFCQETWLLRGWKFIFFHKKTCLPAGKNFKGCYLPIWRERDVCNFATWVKVLEDLWNRMDWEMKFGVISASVPEVQVNGWHKCVSFLTRWLSKQCEWLGAAHSIGGRSRSTHKSCWWRASGGKMSHPAPRTSRSGSKKVLIFI